MKRPVCFIGALQFTNCNTNNLHCLLSSSALHISHDSGRYSSIASSAACAAIRIRGGATSKGSSQLQCLSTATSSLLAGSIAGAIGVGVSYPFDTMSTKAQIVTMGNTDNLSLASKFMRVLKEEGVTGFFEGVALTVSLSVLIDIYDTCNFLTNCHCL